MAHCRPPILCLTLRNASGDSSNGLGCVWTPGRECRHWCVLFAAHTRLYGCPKRHIRLDNAERKVSPAAWTEQNIEHMRRQMLSVGLRFDWSRVRC
jgi:leucyl-tRNA synthetase